MGDPLLLDPDLQLALELTGVFVAAISGALLVVRRKAASSRSACSRSAIEFSPRPVPRDKLTSA